MQFFARQGAHKFYLEQQPLQCVCQPVTVQHLPEAGESSLPIELAPSLTLTVVSNCRLDTRCDSACWDCLRAASVRDRGMMDQGCPNEAVSVLSYSLHGWLRSHRVESRRGWVEFSRDFKAVRSVVLTPLSIFPAFSCALNTKRQKRGFPVWIGQDWQRRVTLAALYKAALTRRALNTGIGLAFFFRAVFGKRGSPRCTIQQADQELGIRCLGVEDGNSGRRHERTERALQALAKSTFGRGPKTGRAPKGFGDGWAMSA